MEAIIQKISEFESRISSVSETEISRRQRLSDDLTALNKIEGLSEDNFDKRLHNLVIYGKISDSEYISLCTELAFNK
ncbi:MAG: hypothetical protein SFT90_07385 [Rickettsiales bacterium]|nr:hypothetical protein [Rickettsiales bacterium]